MQDVHIGNHQQTTVNTTSVCLRLGSSAQAPSPAIVPRAAILLLLLLHVTAAHGGASGCCSAVRLACHLSIRQGQDMNFLSFFPLQ